VAERKSARGDAGSRLVHGFHAVLGKLRRDPEAVFEVYVSEQRHDIRMRELISLTEQTGVRVMQMAADRLEGMVGTRRHQGVVASVSARERAFQLDDVLDTLPDDGLLLVLDGVQDPHNLGACLRVADAAGAHALIVPKDRAASLNATAMKVASGAAESVPFVAVTNLARALRQIKQAGIWTIGTAGEAETALYDFRHVGPVAWVMGAEGSGLRRLTRETCDELVYIPMHGSVESLNVSVASGICLFETCRQRIADSARE